jgi:hypothetical protein
MFKWFKRSKSEPSRKDSVKFLCLKNYRSRAFKSEYVIGRTYTENVITELHRNSIAVMEAEGIIRRV